MNNLLHKLIKFFETKIGWFFINGRKQNKFSKYLKNKYKKDK